MLRKHKVLIVTGAIAIAAALGGGALALSAGERETPISGEALERAGRAALDHTGGGRVTDTEVGDEEGFYEVEVTLDDGSQVDVHLDRDFNVIGDETDDESSDGDDAKPGSDGDDTTP